MVKIQVPDGFHPVLPPHFPPDGQDSAQICSKFWLQFLRLMALPVIEESSYLDYTVSLSQLRTMLPNSISPSVGPKQTNGVITQLSLCIHIHLLVEFRVRHDPPAEGLQLREAGVVGRLLEVSLDIIWT